MTDLTFRNRKEFLDFINSLKNCTSIKHGGYCPDIFDHYFYDDDGKKIRRGKSDGTRIFMKDMEEKS
jgi:hypothetical protein